MPRRFAPGHSMEASFLRDQYIATFVPSSEHVTASWYCFQPAGTASVWMCEQPVSAARSVADPGWRELLPQEEIMATAARPTRARQRLTEDMPEAKHINTFAAGIAHFSASRRPDLPPFSARSCRKSGVGHFGEQYLAFVTEPPSFKVWKVQQYCYFVIASGTVTADEITAAIGMRADIAKVRGSTSVSPRVVPVEHSWRIVCDEHGRIDEQITPLLRRIEPVSLLVRQLVDRGDVSAGTMMVRYFDDEDGGYNAMGWGLEREQLALLVAMGADLQADEYLDNAHPSEYEYADDL